MDEQTYSGGRSDKISRPPKEADLVLICRELNRLGAKYIVVGGFAVIHAGFARFTNDIDFLVDTDPQNEARVFEALRILPDKAVDQLNPGDIARHVVVRIADEVVVDLMAKACGVDFQTASTGIERDAIEGVVIPFASAKILLRMKQTHRDKDVQDRAFLEAVIKSSEGSEDDPSVIESVRRFFKNGS